MRILKSGFMPFFIGVAIIFAYFFNSNYQFGPHTRGDISIFNVLFTLLFLLSCCIAAFQYGKRLNKGGLFGLIGIWALFYIALLFAPIPGIPDIIGLIIFSYCTLFLIRDLIIFLGSPAIMIIIMICVWFIGKKHIQRV
jgi:hypothetical protein